MKLLEIFKSSLPYKIIDNDEDLFTVSFQDRDGNTYQFFMENLDITNGISTWVASFNSTDKELGITFMIIGGRTPFLIFSTIADIFTQAVKSTGAGRVYFNASKSEFSRVSLYKKLTPLLAKHLGWNYIILPNITEEVIFAVGQPGVDLKDASIIRSLYNLDYEDYDKKSDESSPTFIR